MIDEIYFNNNTIYNGKHNLQNNNCAYFPLKNTKISIYDLNFNNSLL